MVVSKETLDALREIGLNMYQRKIYAALLSRGVSTAGELSEMTNVPRSRAYDVLESLAHMGFAILKPSKPREYVAIPPEEALENAKVIYKDRLNDQLNKIDKFKTSESVQELNRIYDEGISLVNPSDLSGALKGRYNVYQHVGNMFKEAQNEILIMTTEKGLLDLQDHQFDLLERAKRRGVNIRILAPVTDTNREARDRLQSISEIRSVPSEQIRSRLSMVDNRKMALSLTHEEVHPTQDTAFWTESEHLAADSFGPMFDFLWNQAQ